MDHNKERVFERACDLIDATTDGMIAGTAFHWYSGDHFEALDLVRQQFPDKSLFCLKAAWNTTSLILLQNRSMPVDSLMI